MKLRNGIGIAATLFTFACGALAADPVKIGLILPMTGPFAAYGKQIDHGVRLYLAKHGDTFGGRKIELVVKDKVDILAGFGLTPSAFAVAPVATEAKKPMVVMNAATSAVTTKSNYIVRVSMTLPQITAPVATWAAKNGIKKVFTVVADYGPGHDAEGQFKKTFVAGGGEIVGEVRVPVKNADFAPYLQKVKDTRPDAVFVFLPAGELGVSFVKGFRERGLEQAGIKLIATGDLTEEESVDAHGDAAVGVINSFHYAEAHASPENKAFTEAYAKAYPSDRPNFMAVAGYDGMHLIAEVLAKTGGSVDADKFVDTAKGMKWMSPRGPISIDPATRDIVQTVYVRKVQRVGGKLQNVEFDHIDEFKDPGKQ